MHVILIQIQHYISNGNFIFFWLRLRFIGYFTLLLESKQEDFNMAFFPKQV